MYLWKKHPLAGKKVITLDDLQEYPCLTFEQGVNNSFYYAEEMMSTYEYKRVIKADDRATMLNLMVGLNGFTLCSGIISEDLNGDDYAAIPLKEQFFYTRYAGNCTEGHESVPDRYCWMNGLQKDME